MLLHTCNYFCCKLAEKHRTVRNRYICIFHKRYTYTSELLGSRDNNKKVVKRQRSAGGSYSTTHDNDNDVCLR